MYRIIELNRTDRKIYHSNDLAILWNIANKNTLYTTIKRYVQKGVLVPIYKGLYGTVPIPQLDPMEIGKAIIHRYTYLSTESVLAQEGIISQVTYAHTFISSISKRVSIGDISFRFRKLKDEYLFNPTGILNKGGNLIATTERAVADMLYYNPKVYFDFSESIDWEKVKELQKEIGYPC